MAHVTKIVFEPKSNSHCYEILNWFQRNVERSKYEYDVKRVYDYEGGFLYWIVDIEFKRLEDAIVAKLACPIALK